MHTDALHSWQNAGDSRYRVARNGCPDGAYALAKLPAKPVVSWGAQQDEMNGQGDTDAKQHGEDHDGTKFNWSFRKHDIPLFVGGLIGSGSIEAISAGL